MLNQPEANANENFGVPISSRVSVIFGNSNATFKPSAEALLLLQDVEQATAIYVNGRTSTARPNASDEALALRRALAARSFLIAHGVSPLKIMVNFASAADFVADNSTADGRRENQRVDIELVFVPKL